MFALLCADAQTAKNVRDQSDGIFELQVVTAMSTLKSIADQIEGIFLDQRLGEQVVNAVRGSFPRLKIYVFETPFFLSEAMAWYESQRVPEQPVQETGQAYPSQGQQSFTQPQGGYPQQGGYGGGNQIPPANSQPSYSQPSQTPPPVHSGSLYEERQMHGNGERNLEENDYTQPSRFSSSTRGVRKRLVPVFMLDSPKGGQGRSTIGAHMAYYGALQGKKVAIIDLDPNGDINAKFGLLESTDNRNWRGDSVDEAVREHACLVHESGLHIFPSPQSNEVAFQSSEDAVHFLTVCIEEMDAVFLDMPQGWTPIHTSVLPWVTKIIAVVSPNTDSLDRIQEHMDKIHHANVRTEDVIPVVNKTKTRSDLSGMKQYMSPYKAEISVPYDRDIEKKGGLNGKLLIRSCKPWWDEAYGLVQAHKQNPKKKWRLFGR